MTQGIVGLAAPFTDIASTVAADSAYDDVDLGPDGLSLIPDEGAIAVILKILNDHSTPNHCTIQGKGSTDFPSGLDSQYGSEDWGIIVVPVPDSGANANIVEVAKSASGIRVWLIAYIPPEAGHFELDADIYTSAKDIHVNTDVSSINVGGDVLGCIFGASLATSIFDLALDAKHPDQDDDQDVWASPVEAAFAMHGVQSEINKDRTIYGFASWANGSDEIRFYHSSNSMVFHVYGYLKDGFCTRTADVNGDPINHTADLTSLGWNTVDVSTEVAAATEGVLITMTGPGHKSSWVRNPDAAAGDDDPYPGNSLADTSQKWSVGQGGVFAWVGVNIAKEFDVYLELGELDHPLGVLGYAIDGGGVPVSLIHNRARRVMAPLLGR